MRLLVASLCSLFLANSQPQAYAAAADTGPVPLEQFFQRPQTSGATISPDGRYVALRRLSASGRLMLVVLDVNSKELKPVANFRNADIDQFFWLGDGRLCFLTVNIDHDGDSGKSAYYAVDRDGQNRIMLHEAVDPLRSFADGDRLGVAYQQTLGYGGFATTPAEELYVVVHYPDTTELARMSTRTGRIHNFRLPHNTERVLIDADCQPRVASGLRNQQRYSYLREGDSWREIASYPGDNPDGFWPLLYAGERLYVRSRNGHDEAAVYRYDASQKKIVEPALVSAPGFDTDGYFLVGDRDLLGYRFNTDAETTVWFDAGMNALQQQVDQQFPGMVNLIARGSHSATPYVLVETHSDIQSRVYMLYNSQTREVYLLGSAHPDLPIGRMANVSMERFAARDGRQIPVFITLPRNAGKAPYPTVVLNDSNMHRRNGMWDWQAEAQFLAARGYAVLQVSPRGSGGFGLQHTHAKQQGQNADPLTDLADAVQWAARQGHTDPARVCIAGGGSGGYAALQSLRDQPDRYQCAISWSALLSREGSADSARLNDLRKPVLLAYDKGQHRLDYQQGRKLYETLQAQQTPVQWLEYESKIDDWKTQQPRIDLWRQIEAFLAKYIGQPAH